MKISKGYRILVIIILIPYYYSQKNIDVTFEANEGPSPVDLKMSRGNDKTVVKIKLSSNTDYFHGYEEQIEEYAKAEGTLQRVFDYRFSKTVIRK